MPKKKLIEVALPLDMINVQSVREKSIRRGHPSTLHLWWSRKPTATARSILFAQLVDDPSVHEVTYREEAARQGLTEEMADEFVSAQILKERERLFGLMEKLSNWDNLLDPGLLEAAQEEIRKSTNGHPPAVLDPFAGGGTISLEAQRLGLTSRAADLNPVAVLITKAVVEIPQTFVGRQPVFPSAAAQRLAWSGNFGLAEDVRRYGAWMRSEAQRRLGHMYPTLRLDNGEELTVVAWLWAWTVVCPNPACELLMPLVSKWALSTRSGHEAYASPTVTGRVVKFAIANQLPRDSDGHPLSTMSGRTGTTCIKCGATISVDHVRRAGQRGELGKQLLATVAEGQRSRLYIAPTDDQVKAAIVPAIDPPLSGEIAHNPRFLSPPLYGLSNFSDIFTPRQLQTLAVYSELVGEARSRVLSDALNGGMEAGERLESGGHGAIAYSDAIATYLGLAVSNTSDDLSALVSWRPTHGSGATRSTFARQALPMIWDFAEANPFSGTSGDFGKTVPGMADVLERLPEPAPAEVRQSDAVAFVDNDGIISTDPPYYDNIGYSDLADFFYVWLRRSLRDTFPKLFGTMLVPKSDELVANPYRHEGVDGAKVFFEIGFARVFAEARRRASSEYPITVYYAFKQTESVQDGEVSTGWQTILSGIVNSGWTVTATWPMRSERGGRMTSIGTNALASSIVLALRPRADSAPIVDRRAFVAELREVLPGALRDLQLGSIAPVDLAQAAIGPGMAVYSKYAEVIEPDGARMPVRAALQQINAILAEVLSAQEGDFDADTRWCVAWFESRGFEEGPFGEAEVLANAKGSSVEGIRRSGVIVSRAGKVLLLDPASLPDDYDPRVDDRISLWELVMHLARAMRGGGSGVDGAGELLARAEERGLDSTAAQELAYLLFSVCQRKGWISAGILFNSVGSSWPEIRSAARAAANREGDGHLMLHLDGEY